MQETRKPSAFITNQVSKYGADNSISDKPPYIRLMVSQIYPSELQLNKANTSDTEATFLGLHLSISNDIVSTKIYDKCDALILKLSISHF